MTKYTLDHYEQQLRHQVIHMDQAVCYCPEFRATRQMHHYPSRRLQLARAIWLGQLPLSEYSGNINFASILSRQGERWQNFGENPEDCTDATILVREMLLKKGYRAPEADDLQASLAEYAKQPPLCWDLPIDPTSKTAVLLDGATAQTDGERAFAAYCQKEHLTFVNQAQAEIIGFCYFACGLVEQGTEHLRALIEKYNAMNVNQVLVLSAQAAYMLTVFAKKLSIKPRFDVVYLLDRLSPIRMQEKTYVYAGSFLLRYLGYGEKLNALVPSENETKQRCSQEFIPLLQGNARINHLTIWQKPLGAEYEWFGNEELMKQIQNDALEDIRIADAKQILVFEPTAVPVLRQAFPDKKVSFFLDLL